MSDSTPNSECIDVECDGITNASDRDAPAPVQETSKPTEDTSELCSDVSHYNGFNFRKRDSEYILIYASTPRNVTDGVISNSSQVRLTEPSFPVTTLANITAPRHDAYLKRINLGSKAERRETYEQWPSYPALHLVEELAKDGVFYLRNLDRTQFFACSEVLRNWSGNDVVRDQHRKHFPRCGFVLGLNVGNVPMTNSARERAEREERARLEQLNANHGEPPDPPQDQQRHLALAYPCNNPINRHMVSLQRRIETFDTRWPSNRINGAVEDISKAGFFFLGESDKTKCFYCNGGLQNWNPNDEPWTEHAKWFPGCEFVLRKKGVDFVRTIADAHPNLNRPYIRNPVPFHDIPPSDVRRTDASEMMETTPSTLASDTERIINDMGFSKAAFDWAMEKRRNEGGVFSNTEELVQYMLDHSDEERNEVVTASGAIESAKGSLYLHNCEKCPQMNCAAPLPGQGESRLENPNLYRGVAPNHQLYYTDAEVASSLSASVTNIREPNNVDNNQNMETVELPTVTCLVCERQAEMTVLPCGHFCLCEPCSKEAVQCPRCGSEIQYKQTARFPM